MLVTIPTETKVGRYTNNQSEKGASCGMVIILYSGKYSKGIPCMSQAYMDIKPKYDIQEIHATIDYKSDDWREWRGTFSMEPSSRYRHTLKNGTFHFVLNGHNEYVDQF